MNKFIELRGYTDKDAIIHHLENKKFGPNEEYSLLAIRRAGGNPADDKYLIRLYDSILNLNADCLQFVSLNKKEYNSPLNEDNISMNKVYIMRELGGFLGYLSNCTSWRENHNSIQDFDKDKLLKSLDRIKQLIDK